MKPAAVFVEEANPFLPLLLVVLLAFFVPIILSRFQRVPVVVGEILAGIIIGPSLLGWVTEAPVLTFMSDIGLAFLMFLAGMEINLATLFPSRTDQVRQRGPSLLPLTLRVFILTLGLAVLGGFVLRASGAEGDPWLLAFVLTATSLGVVLPILKDRDILDSSFGQFILLSATVADFVTVILLTIYIITFDRGFDLEILSLGLLFLAFLIFYRIGPGFIRIPAVRSFFEELSQATVQIKVRGAIAILVSFVVLAEFVDAELILGAFLAGMIISLLMGPEDEALIHKLEAFGFGFFIPVFFIMVGVDLDLSTLVESPEKLILLPELFAIAIVVKLVPLLTLRGRFARNQIMAGGFLLNTHLSLEIAVAVIGVRTGLFDAATSADVILFAILTVVTMPLLFNAILPHVVGREKRHMLVVGVNDLAIKVAQELRAHGDEVRFLEEQGSLIEKVVEAGFEVAQGQPTYQGLEQMDLSQVETLLALNEDEQQNLALACQAKSMGQDHVVAWVRDPTLLPEFRRLGIQSFTPAMHRITMIVMMARNPDTYTLLTSTSDSRDISEAYLYNGELIGARVRDLRLPGDCLLLSIRRAGELLIPRGNTRLAYGDRLTILGDLDDVEDLRNWLEGRGPRIPRHVLSDVG
jgi:Kef-type K+ transport system membrane component KefB/Trk K+ transport system NAD-binding subunit